MAKPKTQEEYCKTFCDLRCPIPQHMWEGMYAYFINHRQTGSFLRAVLCNDLCRAVQKADITNQRLLPNYVMWLHNYAPDGSFGSEDAYVTWTAHYVMPAEESENAG